MWVLSGGRRGLGGLRAQGGVEAPRWVWPARLGIKAPPEEAGVLGRWPGQPWGGCWHGLCCQRPKGPLHPLPCFLSPLHLHAIEAAPLPDSCPQVPTLPLVT